MNDITAADVQDLYRAAVHSQEAFEVAKAKCDKLETRVAELERVVERFQMSAGIALNYLQRCEPSELRDSLIEAFTEDLELAMEK